MKKLARLFLCLIVILFLACSKNSEGGNTPTPENPKTMFPGNFQPTGSSANDILANTNFDKLQIEIAYVTGFKPTNEAMSQFQTFLQQFTFKENIELIFNELPSPNKESLDLNEDIGPLELENRTVYSDETTLGIYIYFADAPAEGDDLDEGLVTLGAVYFNTSMIIYEQTIRTLAAKSNILTNADVEIATLNHEFGHLLGLVNLGTPTVNNHEDLDSENHCNVDPCLMRAELEFGATGKANLTSKKDGELHSSCMLDGLELIKQMEASVAKGAAAAPDLDTECLLDLETNGGRPQTNS